LWLGVKEADVIVASVPSVAGHRHRGEKKTKPVVPPLCLSERERERGSAPLVGSNYPSSDAARNPGAAFGSQHAGQGTLEMRALLRDPCSPG